MCEVKNIAKAKVERLIEAMDRLTSALEIHSQFQPNHSNERPLPPNEGRMQLISQVG